MISKLRERITSAHLIAMLALFVALGGSAYAANKVGTNQIKNNAVTAPKIKNNAVTAAKIKANAVTGAKVGAGAISAAKLANGAVTLSKIGDQQVEESKIADNAITSYKLANGSVTPEKMTEYTNSGMIKLSLGQEKVLLTRGPFTFTAKCADGGGGLKNANLVVKNNGAGPALFESDGEGNYATPVLDPGGEKNAFYPVGETGPYWFGEYYNMFTASTYDGSTSLQGQGNIGTSVAGADCVFQLFTLGA